MNAVGIITILSVVIVITASDRVNQVGGDIRPSSSGVDTAGATFLLSDDFGAEGVLFAFQAYFRSDKPVRFQIWRPVDSDGNFKLISDTRVVPSVTNGVEDIYISQSPNDCTFVRPGDRIGLSFEATPGSVAYVFDPNAVNTDFGTSLDPTSPLELNTVVDFDPLMFPYDFSVAAFVDTDLSRYTVNADGVYACPADLFIPGSSTEGPPTTTESATTVHEEVTSDDLITDPVSTGVPYDVSTSGDDNSNFFSNLFDETKDYILLGVVGGLILIIIIVAIACTIAKRRAEEDTVVKVIERLPSLPDVEWLTQNHKSTPIDPAMYHAPIYNDHLMSKYNAVPSETSTSTPVSKRAPPLSPGKEDSETWQGSLQMRWDSIENIDETRTESTHCPDNLSMAISEGSFLEGRTSC